MYKLLSILLQCHHHSSDNIEELIESFMDNICDGLYLHRALINSECFQNFIHLKFLGGSLGYIIVWIYFLIILGCLVKFISRFIKNWYHWFLMPKKSIAEQKDMTNDPAFTVRLNVLKGKASRIGVKLWGELENMEKGGMAHPENEGYEAYSKNLALVAAYDEIIEAKPTTMFDLEELEWKFNNGALRTPDEVEEHEQEMEQKLYEMSGLYNYEKNLLEEEFENKHILAGYVTIALLLPNLCMAGMTEGGSFCVFLASFFFTIPFLLPAMVILFVTLTFIDLTFEAKFFEVAKKAGKRYLPHIQTITDAAGLAMSLHSLGKMFKKKK